ncbi:hypothetical protein [Nonomuraea rubra]|uniref:hypothetical protein n=1 Tax=Nonomuraea rubra TaxID=46180 RepID=UPI0031F14B1B
MPITANVMEATPRQRARGPPSPEAHQDRSGLVPRMTPPSVATMWVGLKDGSRPISMPIVWCQIMSPNPPRRRSARPIAPSR